MSSIPTLKLGISESDEGKVSNLLLANLSTPKDHTYIFKHREVWVLFIYSNGDLPLHTYKVDSDMQTRSGTIFIYRPPQSGVPPPTRFIAPPPKFLDSLPLSIEVNLIRCTAYGLRV